MTIEGLRRISPAVAAPLLRPCRASGVTLPRVYTRGLAVVAVAAHRAAMIKITAESNPIRLSAERPANMPHRPPCRSVDVLVSRIAGPSVPAVGGDEMA
jgi:hypothetical protein